jgi:hypothetical protein
MYVTQTQYGWSVSKLTSSKIELSVADMNRHFDTRAEAEEFMLELRERAVQDDLEARRAERVCC